MTTPSPASVRDDKPDGESVARCESTTTIPGLPDAYRFACKRLADHDGRHRCAITPWTHARTVWIEWER